MTNIRAEGDVQAFLSQVKQRAFVHDEHGTLLGVFVPGKEAEEEFLAWARSVFDLEEIERRKATEKGTSTTKEILERLQALEPTSR